MCLLVSDAPGLILRSAVPAEEPEIVMLRLAALVSVEMSVDALGAARDLMGALPDVDADLIGSGRYLVAERCGDLVGGAGWSVLPLAFAGERLGLSDDRSPATLGAQAVLLRGFFLDPDLGGRTAAAAIIDRIAAEAGNAGFRAVELFAPASAHLLYRGFGFRPVAHHRFGLADGTVMPLVQLRRALPALLAAAA